MWSKRSRYQARSPIRGFIGAFKSYEIPRGRPLSKLISRWKAKSHLCAIHNDFLSVHYQHVNIDGDEKGDASRANQKGFKSGKEVLPPIIQECEKPVQCHEDL